MNEKKTQTQNIWFKHMVVKLLCYQHSFTMLDDKMMKYYFDYIQFLNVNFMCRYYFLS